MGEKPPTDLSATRGLASLRVYLVYSVTITLNSKFGFDTKTSCPTEFPNCFRDKLTLTEKIQEIAFAIKRKIDMIVDDEEKKKEKCNCKDPKVHNDPVNIPTENCTEAIEVYCRIRQKFIAL
jgi:hypothetical protein